MINHTYIFILSLISVFFLTLEFKRGWMPAACNLVSRMSTSWLNFLIMVWMLFTLALAGSTLFTLISKTIPLLATLPEGTQSILHGYCVQGLLLGTLVVFLFKLSFWINDLGFHRLSLRSSLIRGASGFFSALPFIWITSVSWGYLLELLHKWGVMAKPTHQHIVNYLLNTQAVGPFIGSFILSVIIAPIIEEMIFRGIMYRFFKDKFSLNIALISSAFVFALIHYNLLTFAPLLVVGILLVRVYEQTGDIKACMVFHGLFNLNTLILIILQHNETSIL